MLLERLVGHELGDVRVAATPGPQQGRPEAEVLDVVCGQDVHVWSSQLSGGQGDHVDPADGGGADRIVEERVQLAREIGPVGSRRPPLVGGVVGPQGGHDGRPTVGGDRELGAEAPVLRGGRCQDRLPLEEGNEPIGRALGQGQLEERADHSAVMLWYVDAIDLGPLGPRR